MGTLTQLGLITTRNAITDVVFDSLFVRYNYLTLPYTTPKEYVKKYWDAYEHSGRTTRALNGKMFEVILATLFIRENIKPYYFQAKLEFVPAIDYDFIFYKEDVVRHPVERRMETKRKPLAISLKTSLRERWKQADLEAEALKRVYREGKCFLISKEEEEVRKNKERIKNGDAVGLDRAIYCFSDEFDDFINDMKALTPFSKSNANVSVVVSNNFIL